MAGRHWNVDGDRVVVTVNLVQLTLMTVTHPPINVQPHPVPDQPVTHQVLCCTHARMGKVVEEVKHPVAQRGGDDRSRMTGRDITQNRGPTWIQGNIGQLHTGERRVRGSDLGAGSLGASQLVKVEA